MPYQQLKGYVPEEKIEEDVDDHTMESEEEEESSPNITHGTRLWSILSVVFSAVGIALVFIPAVGIFFGLAGIVFAVVSRRKNGYFYNTDVVGIVIGSIAVAALGFFIVYNAMNAAGAIPNIFEELIK